MGQLKEATRIYTVVNRGGLLTVFKDIAKQAGEALRKFQSGRLHGPAAVL